MQAECRNLGDSDTPEVSDLLKSAARCLNERPVLFKYCAEEVCTLHKLSKVILTSTEDALHIAALEKENAFSRLQTQGTIHYFVVL